MEMLHRGGLILYTHKITSLQNSRLLVVIGQPYPIFAGCQDAFRIQRVRNRFIQLHQRPLIEIIRPGDLIHQR